MHFRRITLAFRQQWCQHFLTSGAEFGCLFFFPHIMETSRFFLKITCNPSVKRQKVHQITEINFFKSESNLQYVPATVLPNPFKFFDGFFRVQDTLNNYAYCNINLYQRNDAVNNTFINRYCSF